MFGDAGRRRAAGCASAGSPACARSCDERAPRGPRPAQVLSPACTRSTACRFDVEAGSITGLIGPNGSGKSTAIDCISASRQLDGGRVVLAGADITGRAAQHIARAGLMRTFQTVRIYERLSLRDNLAIAGAAVRSRPPGSTSSCARGAIATRSTPPTTRARELVELIGLGALLRGRDRHAVVRPEEAGGAGRRPDAAAEGRGARRAGGRRQPDPHPRDRGWRCASSTRPARPS